MQRLRDLIIGIALHLLWIFPIDKKKVVLKSFRGQNCGDNPGALYKELIKRRPDLKYYWVMKDTTIKIPGAIVIKNGSFSELFHLVTARLWIDNKRKGMWCTKRKVQFYVQTWHAGITLKKVEADARDSLSSYYLKNAEKDSQNADIFLSDSKWTTKLYRQAFFYKGNILECGLPRADIFYCEKTVIRKKVYNYFNLGDDVKLALYAPTFRVDEKLDAYNIDYVGLQKSLIQQFCGKWKVIVRLHPNIARKIKDITTDKNITINGNQYQDINELIVASEVVITDYSSCMFDAMVAGKTVFLYASDIETYDADRGRYFSFSELPFALSTNNEELHSTIMNYCEDKYRIKVSHFMQQLGFVEGGHACEKVCDYLDTII